MPFSDGLFDEGNFGVADCDFCEPLGGGEGFEPFRGIVIAPGLFEPLGLVGFDARLATFEFGTTWPAFFELDELGLFCWLGSEERCPSIVFSFLKSSCSASIRSASGRLGND